MEYQKPEEHKEIKTAETHEKTQIIENIEKSSENSEEIAVDFTKIKDKIRNLFSKKKHLAHHEIEKKDELLATWDFIKKYKSFFLILIPLFLCIFFRMYPAYLPITDEWGKNSVESYFKSQIAEQINQKYPNLPDTNKNVLINDEWNKFYGQNKDNLEEQIKATSQQFRAQFQDDTGQTYLGEIDPWSWWRDADNYLEHGYYGDVEINGKYYDNHRLAPLLEEDIKAGGSTNKYTFLLPVLEVYFYKAWHFFDGDVSLIKAAYFMPVILCALAIIPAYFLVRRVAGDIGGLVAATLLAVNPFVLSRTVAGFSDTDGFNLLFPLMIFWMLILAIEAKSIWLALIYSIIGSFSMGLYSFSWGGWMFSINFVVFICMGVVLFRVIKGIIKEKKVSFEQLKMPLLALMLFIILGGIFTGMFNKFHEFKDAPKGLIYFIELKDVATKDIWPNVFTTVAELNPGDISNIFGTVGGKLFLFMGLFGILMSFYIGKDIHLKDLYIIIGSFVWFLLIISMRDSFSSINSFLIFLSIPIIIKYLFVLFIEGERYNIVYPTLLFIYMFGTMFSITRGVRFSLLLAPAFAISCGIFVGVAIKRISNVLETKLSLNKIISYSILIILVALILIQPVQDANRVAYGEIPLINRQWVEALTKIKEDSNETAMVNSWWDFGHWFKAIADRGVTLDGGGQDKPQAHWLGKLMLAKTEEESVGVLRLLVCGKNYPYDRLFKILKDGEKAKKIIDEIIPVDKEEARKILESNNISEEDTEYLLSRTHCEPPADYFITSEDMVSKSGVWGHFGSWDFTRASMYNLVKAMKKEEGIAVLIKNYNLSEETAKKYYNEIQTTPADQWVSSWPGYVTSRPTPCKGSKDDEKIICPVPAGGNIKLELEIDIAKKQGSIKTSQGEFYPNELVIPTEKGVEIIRYKDNLLGYSANIIPNNNGYSVLYSHPLHAGSMFTRLFYMEGHGLEHFEKFYDVRDVTGARIIVWKINWEGKERNKPYESFFNTSKINSNS